MNKSFHEVVDDAMKSIREAARADAIDEAVDLVNNDEELIQQVIDASINLWVNGIPFNDESESPLTITAVDSGGTRVYKSHDPIAYAIELMQDYSEFDDDDCQRYFNRCIESLQSGIDRLKAYEAERLTAESKGAPNEQ